MILFVTNGINRAAGTERVICNLSTALSEKFQLKLIVPGSELCAFNDVSICNVYSIGIGEFPGKGLLSKVKHRISYFNTLRKSVSSSDTLVGFSFDLNIVCILVAILKGCKVYCCEHIHYEYHNVARRLMRKIFYRSRFATVIVLTDSDRDKFEIAGVKSIVIPNFIEHSPLNYYPKDRFLQKKILSVGRLTDQKNYVFLLEAFFVSKVWKCGWRLDIVGDGEGRDELLSWIANKEMQSYIKLIPATPNIKEFYTNASIFCMSSKFEAFPMVLLEAMNSMLPIVTTDCPTGPRQIIGEDHLGQIIDLNDLKSYAECLKKYCESYEFSKTRAEHNHARVKVFDKKEIIRKWQGLLLEK